MPEVNYKVDFAKKYFNIKFCEFDVLKEVDILLRDRNNDILLYIESKYIISNDTELRKALAQLILTNHKQEHQLDKLALIYQDKEGNDILQFVDCADNSIMYNNDINWEKEKPSNPSIDAINRINDRIQGHVTCYKSEEIKEFYKKLLDSSNMRIDITLNNVNVVYNQWKNDIEFEPQIENEQELINLFLVDTLKGTTYKKKVKDQLLGEVEEILIREGTDLCKYKFISITEENEFGFIYNKKQIFLLKDKPKYDFFWRKYNRPPEEAEFLKILERSATLYSDKYRRDTGGEYTPSCFVEKQNEILREKYNLDEFIICDTCAGVGNLENEFGMDFKQYCYLSTLEQTDVDICKIKGFENCIQYDYLDDPKEQPKWMYQGSWLSIQEIAKKENKKLMIIINPPYQQRKKFKNNLAIEFFNKILKLNPQVIVFYYQLESFLRDEIKHYIKSKYKIVSHIFSSAKHTFKLKYWGISQIIFDKEEGDKLNTECINADRYELKPKTERLEFIKTYSYNNKRPSLIKEIEKQIKKYQNRGLMLGNRCYLKGCINLDNKTQGKGQEVTTQNLKWSLLSKGINFNTHAKYFERPDMICRGYVKEISEELFGDAIYFSLFYLGLAFTNKGKRNFIMPFTSQQLGCAKNELNILRSSGEKTLSLEEGEEEVFDFREFLRQFHFSQEAKDLFKAALGIFRYYHKSSCYSDKNWNDSFYDIMNAIMEKNPDDFTSFETKNDTRISQVRTTKNSTGFGRNTFKKYVPSGYHDLFLNFFNARDVLAKKINRQLVESHLLLWERENIY